METFPALLALCNGNSSVTDEFPSQRPVTRNFDVFVDLRLNKRLRKHSWGWWFATPSRPLWRHCNVNNIFKFSSLNEYSWMKFHLCLFLRGFQSQLTESQSWFRQQAPEAKTLPEAILTNGSGCMAPLGHCGYSGVNRLKHVSKRGPWYQVVVDKDIACTISPNEIITLIYRRCHI